MAASCDSRVQLVPVSPVADSNYQIGRLVGGKERLQEERDPRTDWKEGKKEWLLGHIAENAQWMAGRLGFVVGRHVGRVW